jgi:hypothetical protein
MKPYRIKHIPTGLYYKPSKGGSNLSTKGKVYLTANSGLRKEDKCLFCHVAKGSSIIKRYGELLGKYKIWENYKMVAYCLPVNEIIKEEL